MYRKKNILFKYQTMDISLIHKKKKYTQKKKTLRKILIKKVTRRRDKK